jgi:bifunctional non-homologous end joining protein LigD
MVFDLDPGPGTTIVECCQVARFVANRLGEENLFAKTSGSKGLQLYMPLTRTTSDTAGERAHEIAMAIEKDHPEAVVSRMRKDLRSNKVLIDWSQNNPHKTTVAAYSLRARSAPSVSTPVSWKEVDQCGKSGNPDLLRFETKDVLQRVEKFGDLMEPVSAPRPGRAAK